MLETRAKTVVTLSLDPATLRSREVDLGCDFQAGTEANSA